MGMMKKKKEVSESNSPVGVLEDYLRSEAEEEEYYSSEDTFDNSPTLRRSNSKSAWNDVVRLFGAKSSKKALDKKTNPNPNPNPNRNKNRPLAALKRNLSLRSFSFREHRFSSVVPKFFPADSADNSISSSSNFSLSDLQFATDNFSPANLIGKGGYAEVYKGCLRNGKLVAVKRLTKGTPDEMTADFLSELGIMAHVKHPNTAKLIGYGVEGGMHLVLQLSSRGSLASALYGSNECMSWEARRKIAMGTAEGLVYLHGGCQRRIIHRDIKAANILLTEDFEPQICDFGLAKWLPEHWTHHTISKFEGTFGYLAPEFLMHGIVDEKTDVFAYGVILLELVTGRRALDLKEQSLVLWAKPLLKKSDIRELVDPALGNAYDARQVNLMLVAAALCIQQSAIRRPFMPQVEQVLRGNLSFLKSTKKCKLPFFRRALKEEFLNAEENRTELLRS
ncbi:Receptor-like cytosolic serine/threonine-protein kinase RBK2 [Linum grandiflorum]